MNKPKNTDPGMKTKARIAKRELMIPVNTETPAIIIASSGRLIRPETVEVRKTRLRMIG